MPEAAATGSGDGRKEEEKEEGMAPREGAANFAPGRRAPRGIASGRWPGPGVWECG